METNRAEGKRSMTDMVMEEGEEEEEEEYEDNNKKKRAIGRKGTNHHPSCQVQGCAADMGSAKPYHRRHKVCELHAKSPAVVLDGFQQRFCQQCSRFHEISEFDEAKRSCRRRLAGHNERRRKSSNESHGEGSS